MSDHTPDGAGETEPVEAPRRRPWYAAFTLYRVFIGVWVLAGALGLVLLGQNLANKDESPAQEEEEEPAVTKKPGTITGSMTLTDDDVPFGLENGDACSGTGGFGDIEGGTQVTVKNEQGHILGIGNLRRGLAVFVDDDLDLYSCKFDFVVDDVGKAKFYSLEVGRRGAITKSRAELEADDWTFELTLSS